MKLENRLAAGKVGQLNGNTAVETARTQQSRIEAIGTVGGRENDDALVVIKTVHLRKQLVERLLALIVTAKAAAIALLADGIDLIDKDDAGGLFLCLFEQVANLGGAATDEHFDELGTGNREERNARLAGNGFGKKGLTGSRRADEQHATRQLGADLLIALGLLEEIDDLFKRLLSLFLACDVFKGNAHVFRRDNACARLAEAAAPEAAAAEIH